MATKKRSWMDDGDDAHFSDNPAVRKRGKRAANAKTNRNLKKSTKQAAPEKLWYTKERHAKTTRKRVASK